MERLRRWQDNGISELKYSRWMSLFPMIHQLCRYREKYQRLLLGLNRRPPLKYDPLTLLAPRADAMLSGAGEQFDAPPAPLKIGLHWILRELMRMGVISGDHIHKDCWVPAEQVLNFLQPLGLESPDYNALHSVKARTIATFMREHLESPHLFMAFDIPLRHVDRSQALKREFGWES